MPSSASGAHSFIKARMAATIGRNSGRTFFSTNSSTVIDSIEHRLGGDKRGGCKLFSLDMKLELVAVPVTDVDRAKAFYVDQVGFHADHDHKVTDELRFVQLTPPGSACSIVLGKGVTEMAPGSQKGLQVVVDDVEAVRQTLAGRGGKTTEGEGQPGGAVI